MKRNVLLIPFVAILALVFVSATASATLFINDVEIADTDVTSGVISGFTAGEVVPVRVWFSADMDQSNVEIEVEFEGYDETESVSQDFGFIEADTEYRSKIFNLRIPNDVDDLSEETWLYVKVSSKDGKVEEEYRLKLQRESYELDILSVDYNPKVSAGDVLPVAVVIENNGYGFSEDNFVIVSIPALGVSARGYIGDLDSTEDYENDNHEEDAVQKVVYLIIPEDAETGVYELEVVAYNDDSKTVAGNLVAVDGVKPADDLGVPNDDSSDDDSSTSVVALTVILVIIFVVLLVVLVILLTRKEKPMEEVETSYY